MSVAADPQELRSLSNTCISGLITGHTGRNSEHVQCENRDCRCYCHGSTFLHPNAWKHHSEPVTP